MIHLTWPRITMAAAATLLVSACTTSKIATAPAQPAGGHGQSAFIGSYDANRDGVVTRAEYDAIRKQRFEAADTNRDGWLNEEEYVAEFTLRLKQQYMADHRQPDQAYENSIKQAHVRFAVVDRDRDGKFSRAEDLAIADRTFKGSDTNGDGRVNKEDPRPEPRGEGGRTQGAAQ